MALTVIVFMERILVYSDGIDRDQIYQKRVSILNRYSKGLVLSHTTMDKFVVVISSLIFRIVIAKMISFAPFWYYFQTFDTEKFHCRQFSCILHGPCRHFGLEKGEFDILKKCRFVIAFSVMKIIAPCFLNNVDQRVRYVIAVIGWQRTFHKNPSISRISQYSDTQASLSIC